ncbi:uncharacterized protein [Macrobrachium rosenbergii]|uniref:uncharacterized protein n=1 Tax=Macrobrachium rosenbergii TaxID=79674 RepID=UPI0034D648A3
MSRPPLLLLVLSVGLQGGCWASSLFPGDRTPRPPTPPPPRPHYYDHPFAHHGHYHPSHTQGGSAFLDFYDGMDDPIEPWEEDESWWDGVEEVVLTNSFNGGFTYDDLYYDDLYDANYTCTDTLECEEFSALPPPPDFILTLPPPPVPPFLQGAIGRLQEEGRKRKKLESTEDEDEDKEQDLEYDQCSLCEWATGGNNTLNLLPPPSESGVGGGMIGVLVGVAFISAVVGAAVMVILLRCRKFKILPSGRDTCPMLLRGTWTKGSNTNAPSSSSGTATRSTDGGGTGGGVISSSGVSSDSSEVAVKAVGENPTAAGGGTTHTGWSMKLWRRGSSQERPLRPSSSQGSENSYTEEPYVNADAHSAVYAELNSTGSTPVSASGVSYHPYSLNTYSEIPDPLRPMSIVSGGLRSYITEGTYENAGYVLSEAGIEHPESSVGSTSTPSSAYYSDVSSSDNQNNKKKKKKRKNEERNNLNLQRSMMPSNISSSVSMINNHILGPDRRLNGPARELPGHVMGQAIHPALHNRELLPLALELLPQHLTLDNRGVEAVLPPLQPNMNVIQTANQVQTLPNLKNINETRAVLNASQNQILGNISSVPSSAAPVESLPHNNNLQGVQEEEDEEAAPHRPLPPLPSRQVQGPQRRGIYVGQSKQDQPLPPVPSEYV